MLKGALLSLIKKYNTNHAPHEESEVMILKCFLETADIKLRHESSYVYFSEFKKYLSNNEPTYFDTHEFSKKTTAAIFNEFMNSDNFSSDQSSLDCFPEETLRHITANYLDAKSIASLSATSSAFYTRTKSIDYWKDKFISAGCDPDLLSRVCETRAITNYKPLYRAFMKMPFLDRSRMKDVWELLCLSGQVSAIKYAIDHESLKADNRSHRGEDALLLSARSGSASAMSFTLASLGIDPNSKSKPGENTFFSSTANNYWFSKMPVEQPWDENALLLAALSGDVLAMEYAINILKIAPKSKNIQDENVLHFALKSGCKAAVEYALKTLEIDPQIKSKNGTTILHFAALSGNIEVFNYVYNNFKSDAESINDLDQTMLHFAARSGSVAMMKHVHGITLNLSADVHGNNVLHFAAMSGSVPAMECAITDFGINPESQNHDGNNALNLTARNGDTLGMEFTSRAIDPKNQDSMNWHGDDAWLMAALSGSVFAMEYARIKLALNPNKFNGRQANALHFIALSGNDKAISYLRQLDAYENTINWIHLPSNKDGFGHDAFNYAEECNNADLIKKALSAMTEEIYSISSPLGYKAITSYHQG